MSSWCCMAETSDEDEHQVLIRSLVGTKSGGLDLTLSPEWMEYMDQGKNSAYDALRCDFLLHQHEWNIWGYDYHINRLEQSFQTLLTMKDDLSLLEISPETMIQAKTQSQLIFQALLDAAATAYQSDTSATIIDDKPEDCWIQLIRFTFLWTPILSSEDDSLTAAIRVCGHASCTGKPISIYQPPSPIVASLAAQVASTTQNQKQQLEVDPELPHRFDNNPSVKLSAWTRQRKPLFKQQQAKYQKIQTTAAATKQESIGEVLLVRQSETNPSTLELLEGLSSNVFVVFKDGGLGTASEDVVLSGYVRHLVLQECPSVRPILLDEVKDWKEVFITSSSRLILPVKQVVVLDQAGQWMDFWSSTSNTSYKWQEIQQKLLESHGYGQRSNGS